MGDEPSTNGHLPSALGEYGGGVHAGRDAQQTTRLIERALKEGWPIDEKYREPIVNRQVSIAINPDSRPGESTRAARTLAMMSRQNAEIAFKLLDKVAPDKHEHTMRDEPRRNIAELLKDEQYVDYLRERDRIADCDAGPVREVRESGNGQPLENGTPPGIAGPGANGDRNGQE